MNTFTTIWPTVFKLWQKGQYSFTRHETWKSTDPTKMMLQL